MDFNINDIPDLNTKINHRNWLQAYAESFAMLSMASRGEVVCITGPSRIGKSRLVGELAKLLSGPDQFEETGLMPVVTVGAANTGPNGTFSTKSFIQRLLGEVKHPMLSLGDDLDNDPFSYQKMDRSTEATLRLALERALVARKTEYLFIDEAQHVRYTTKGAMASHAVMDSWKCLAENSGFVLVLVGAYPILDIIKNSPHLIGRKHQIHFPRYYADSVDLGEFVKIVMAYEEVLNMDKSLKSFSECYEILYEGSYGCIGLLRGWLGRASAFGVANGQGITRDLLERTMLSESDREEVAKEILEGEELLSVKATSSKRTRNLNEVLLEQSTNKKGSSKPFQRKPMRMKPGNRTKGKDDES